MHLQCPLLPSPARAHEALRTNEDPVATHVLPPFPQMLLLLVLEVGCSYCLPLADKRSVLQLFCLVLPTAAVICHWTCNDLASSSSCVLCTDTWQLQVVRPTQMTPGHLTN